MYVLCSHEEVDLIFGIFTTTRSIKYTSNTKLVDYNNKIYAPLSTLEQRSSTIAVLTNKKSTK